MIKFGFSTSSPIIKAVWLWMAITPFNLIGQAYNIILGRPTDTSITVSVMMEQDATCFLEYGTSSGAYDQKTGDFSMNRGVPRHIQINALKANTGYFYRLWYKSGGNLTASPEYRFHTQRPAGSTFTFTLEADEHLYDKKGVKNMYNVTLQNQAADNPDFMISLGDIFGDDHEPFTITSGELDDLHKEYRPFLGSICHSIPFYICLGNHEGENDYYQAVKPPDNLCYWGTQWRKHYYPNPYPNGFYTGNTTQEPYGIGYPENYFAWTWGDALFVVLDVYRTESYDSLSPKPQGWNWTLGLTQYNWLKNTLENSQAKYKIVFAHHLRGQGRGAVALASGFEWGGYQSTKGGYTFPTYRPGWAKPIHQLFRDNKVTMFLQGHDHVFAHEVLDGIRYIAAPMAADSTYEIGMLANADAYLSDTVDGTGHLRFTVSPSCLKMDYVKAYLPKDTLDGKHKNREIGFSLNLGECGSTTASFDPLESREISISPNPVRNTFTLNFENDSKIRSVQACDLYGRQVYQNVRCYSGMRVHCTDWPAGIYVITINGENNQITQKIIVQP